MPNLIRNVFYRVLNFLAPVTNRHYNKFVVRNPIFDDYELPAEVVRVVGRAYALSRIHEASRNFLFLLIVLQFFYWMFRIS